jgi:heme exporter protein A
MNSTAKAPRKDAAVKMADTAPLLALEEVAIMRGHRVIQHAISHEMTSGQMTLLTGPNGSGKSSLLRAIAGRLIAAGGQISCAVPMVYVGHQDGIAGALSGRQNLASWAGVNGVETAGPPKNTQIDTQIDSAITALEADSFADLPTRLLSRGQRRRFALARLYLSPANALWLLDEPSVGLDFETAQRLDGLLSAHLDRGGMVMAATHLPLAPRARPKVLALGQINDPMPARAASPDQPETGK